MTRKELAASYAAKQAAVKALNDKGLDNLTQEEAAQLATELDARDAVKAELDKFPKDDAIKARVSEGDSFISTAKLGVPYPGAGGQAAATKAKADAVADRIEAVDGESEDEKYISRGPFKSLGHYATEVRNAGNQPGLASGGLMGEWNARAKKLDTAVKAITGMSEFVDADGASFVPTQLATGVWTRATAEENLLGLVDIIPVQGNSLTVPAWNDKSRTSGSLMGGARAYWGAEGTQTTSSQPATRKIEFKLNKLAVLMYATEELLEDTTALDSQLTKSAGACFAYEINKAIVRGDGVGKPLGIINAPPKITVTATANAAANTIKAQNVTDMFSRRPPSSLKNLVWLYNIDIEPQLDSLSFTAGTTAAQWMYLSSGGLRDRPEPVLKGRRMIESEHCSALGTEGDLILFDPTSYGVIVKGNGINQAVSMHLRFDYGEAAFRWTFRMDGKPYWDAVLTPANGGTRAPIVTLNSTRT